MSSSEKIMDSEPAKLHAISSIIVSIIVTVGVIVATAILAGGDYGRGSNSCMITDGGASSKAMTSSKAMDVMIMKGDEEIGMQTTWYDYSSNTLQAETPSGASGQFFNSTIVIDYNREVIFISILDQHKCYASSLSGDMKEMSDRSIEFMGREQDHEQAMDIKMHRDIDLNYRTDGQIPAGYVSKANGPIIRALCMGADSYWTKPRMTSSDIRRREIRISTRICVFFICFNLNF
ncbi:uncharacterized protein LOC129276819 [Lytechinus pictus]|uniref:uncharacterized protein LOC129276819 n=1 Tax=Lytechinus pictus TaxID=7653 RepID=UPI0030BA1E15